MNSWMSSCNSAHMANNLMRWWRSKFYKGYKPFAVDNVDPPASDSEELFGRRSADYRVSCSTPPIIESHSTPIITDLPTRTVPHLNLQEFSCDVSLEDVPNQNLQDRQEFSFTLYDFDGHGKITKDDIAGLVTTIYEALGASIKVPHCGSKTIKVKLSVSPEQRKNVSTSVINNPDEKLLEQRLNFNVTVKHETNEKKKNKDHENKKHYCCRKLNEDAEVSDDYSDVCSRMSAEVTATEEDYDLSEEQIKCKVEQKCEQRHTPSKTQHSSTSKQECDVKKHGKSFLHAKKVKKRPNVIHKEEVIELQANLDSNNCSFPTPRKLNHDHINLENDQLLHDMKHHRHRHHRPGHSHNTPLRCLANMHPTHFYVDLMALQNNTQILNGDCQYDKLVDAVMCVSNKKFSECCKRHNNFKNCEVPNCELIENNLNNTKHVTKSVKKTQRKPNEFESPTMGRKNFRKLPRVVLGHTSSPHHLRHRNRQEDQARAMAQVVRWLEQEFSNNLYTNTDKEKTKTTNCNCNKEHPCGMSKNQNYYTEYHEHHHVHEHIHHHYHHYQELSVV
ncbi:hypothetical protein FQA39_LY17039 [Lamprigera yunnana]|nr:hypothetical protein FQA39_LY17039 [Lamprigera yunnana]